MNNLNNENNPRTDKYEDQPARRNNWWPVLLLPIFFILGWASNDTLGTNDQFGNGTTCGLNIPREIPQIPQ